MDLMGGQVVRARRGERHAYQPVASLLCDTSSPLEVARALFELYAFDTLYIADIDAIQQRGDHRKTIESLRSILPDVEIWIDAGVTSFEDCQPWLSLDMCCVIGSESQPDADATWRLIDRIGQEQAVLSLDSINGQPMGPAKLFEDVSRWPQRVIGMTLARVGSRQGPDFELLRHMQDSADGRNIYAAGGVRNVSDMEKLKSTGIAGALLASALHDGEITSGHLVGLEK